MKRWKRLLELFGVFFKIGLFTFGGGYAMISLIEHEIGEVRGWLELDELSELDEATASRIQERCGRTYALAIARDSSRNQRLHPREE